MTEVKQGAEVVCARCGRGIDSCAVCASEACHECICYLCLVVALGHSKPHPHEHGG